MMKFVFLSTLVYGAIHSVFGTNGYNPEKRNLLRNLRKCEFVKVEVATKVVVTKVDEGTIGEVECMKKMLEQAMNDVLAMDVSTNVKDRINGRKKKLANGRIHDEQLRAMLSEQLRQRREFIRMIRKRRKTRNLKKN